MYSLVHMVKSLENSSTSIIIKLFVSWAYLAPAYRKNYFLRCYREIMNYGKWSTIFKQSEQPVESKLVIGRRVTATREIINGRC